MTTRQRLRAALTAFLALAALLLVGVVPAAAAQAPTAVVQQAGPVALPEPVPADEARAELEDLTVAEPHSMDGYSRAKFPHWITIQGTCDTRETVLIRDGADVVTDSACKSVSGTWTSPYDGNEFTQASQLDIDHVVPLAASWRAGADLWDTATRRKFANDLTAPQLVAVSAASNRSKADQAPDTWRPPLRSYWCTYSRAWVDVKHRYHLNVTTAERTALADMLDTCPTT